MGKHSKKGKNDPLGRSRPAKREASEAHERVTRARSQSGSKVPPGARPAGGQRPASGTAGATGARPSRSGLDAQLSPKIKKERRRRAIARVLIGVAVLLAVFLLAGGAYAWYFVNKFDNAAGAKTPQVKTLKHALKKAEPAKPFTVLLLGTDRRPWEKVATRTDTIILAKIDPQKGKIWMLSIPRDTRVEIPGYGVHKINAAHALGGEERGPELTVQTVEKFTGVPINHYAEVNFEGFKAAVDELGGVWVDVDQPIDDWKAASHSRGHQAKKIKAGYQKLDGNHALTYVRSRDFPDADFTRMKHQQTFFKALADQLKKSPVRAPAVVQAVAPHLVTDMSMLEMLRVGASMKDIGKKGLYTATLSGEWKSPFIYTDETMKKKLIAAFKANEPFDKKPSAKKSTESSSSIPPSDITVTIRNGCGTKGLGGEAADVLRKAGYEVGEVGNAKKSTYDRTLVVYNGGNRAAAESVAAALPSAKLVDGQGQYDFSSRVLVVVGKDWKSTASN